MTSFASFYNDHNLNKKFKNMLHEINSRNFIYYLHKGKYIEFTSIEKSVSRINENKNLLTPFKFYYPVPLVIPQSLEDSKCMRIIEDDISTKKLLCLYCGDNFYKSNYRVYSRRHKICAECSRLLYEDFLITKNKISFDEFILSKQIIKEMGN